TGNYFMIHHTQADTVDKIDPADVSRASAAIAVLAYVVADMPTRLGEESGAQGAQGAQGARGGRRAGGGREQRIVSACVIALLIACALGEPDPTVAAATFAQATVVEISAGACASLATITLPDTQITSADEVRGPSFTPPGSSPINGLPAFCRVAGVTKPAV